MPEASFSDEKYLFSPSSVNHGARGTDIPTIFAFPNTYSVGITSLGFQVIWAKLATHPDIRVSRLFTDAQETLPRQPELLGFSFSWELDYANILSLLTQLGIPLRAKDRHKDDLSYPLVFGGGPVLSANPEPYADFFDLILVGDGEELLDDFINGYQTARRDSRAAQLANLAMIPGVYVPSLYNVSYQSPTGAIAAITPTHPQAALPVLKRTYRGDQLLASTVVTPQAAWENIYMVETVRSCPEMCRFCLASYLTLPFRSPSVHDRLIPVIERGLAVTQRIGLLGASVTQHPEFEELLAYFADPKRDQVRLSLASVRTNTVTTTLAQTLVQRGSRSITVAIESGSERLRQIINKKLENAEILAAAANARAGGLAGIKFYGMAGLPGEAAEDLEATVDLFAQLKRQVPGLRLTFGCSSFVPKAHTPFQWYGMRATAEKRLQTLQKKLRPLGVDFRPESYHWSVIQALLARGDRRLTPLLELTRHYGDSLGSYRRAFKELKGQLPPLEDYVNRDIPSTEVLPWSHLQGPLPITTLEKHRQTAAALFPEGVLQ
jgi:radical SAM superfamily enzyme YgiQ (UPF0313 family)